MADKRTFVEQRPQGDYAVRKANAERASAVLPTQAKAIERARELSPGTAPPCGACPAYDRRIS
jgi:hypothetical protein